jgi:hypothetical protein
MDRIRGILMLLAGAFALYRGFTVRTRHTELLAFALGLAAVALGVWHLTRKPPPPRV